MGADISVETHACCPWLAQSTHQHLLHQEGAAYGYRLLTLIRSYINFMTVAVEDACHKDRLTATSIVGHCTISTYKFKEGHIA